MIAGAGGVMSQIGEGNTPEMLVISKGWLLASAVTFFLFKDK